MSDRFVYTSMNDPRARPLIEALSEDYVRLYAEEYGEAATGEMTRYPAERFAPPAGAFMLLMRDGETIGGGAFKSHGPGTAEFKRIWVSDEFRRQGLARKILVELEAEAARQGYTRVYLTTGFRQSAATALYLASGYTPLYDLNADPKDIVTLPFEKQLTPLAKPDDRQVRANRSPSHSLKKRPVLGP